MRVGDGVLAINGVVLENKNSDEVARLLDETDQRPTAVLSVCRNVAASTCSTSPSATISRIGNRELVLFDLQF